MAEPPSATAVELESLAGLFQCLKDRGYQIVGPTVRDGAVIYDTLSGPDDLPAGWTDIQEAGRYRLERRSDGALFGYHCGPQSWKRYLHPAVIRPLDPDPAPRIALLGVRACELAAIRIQDRILTEDRFPDTVYASRRRGALVIAVTCDSPSAVCFCGSMQTGPELSSGFDLALTEIVEESRHVFALAANSASGAEILETLGGREIDPSQAQRAGGVSAPQVRRLDLDGLPRILRDSFDHPRWDDVAQRCLACGNCTMVCPTCFCTTVEDTSDITGRDTARTRRWDSCFTLAFSYIHGGSVRASVKSRYRQWLTHKFSYWMDQFGTFGCVGCGRCTTWCPAGIDIVKELNAIRAGGAATAARAVQGKHNGND